MLKLTKIPPVPAEPTFTLEGMTREHAQVLTNILAYATGPAAADLLKALRGAGFEFQLSRIELINGRIEVNNV